MDPARTTVLEVSRGGSRGNVELTFGEWQENHLDIAFRDRFYRNSGVIRFDGSTAKSVITTLRPYQGPLADPSEFNDYFRTILQTFGNSYTFGWSPEPQQMISYDADYHELNKYIQGDPAEIAIKSVQARIISELANPRNQQWTIWQSVRN